MATLQRRRGIFLLTDHHRIERKVTNDNPAIFYRAGRSSMCRRHCGNYGHSRWIICRRGDSEIPSDRPQRIGESTRANFPFVWAAALREKGYEVRIELAGDATVLMRSAVSNSVTPVGWPPFRLALAKVVELKIPIFV